MIKIALTKKNPIQCDLYLYPSELYDIEGMEQYDDLKTLHSYAYKRLERYKGKEIGLYINGGLLIEILIAIQVMEELNCLVHVFHWNRETDMYTEQKIRQIEQSELIPSKEVVKRCLCSGRHFDLNIPPIFEKILKNQVMDFEWMQKEADFQLEQLKGKQLSLYMTGLTPAVISVWNAARKYFIPLEVFHYNIDTEEYFSQRLV